MPLQLEQKKQVVAEVAEVAGSALSAVAAEYSGLSVSELTELRQAARQANVYVRVVPNNLARRAFADTEFACMSEVLRGPLILALSKEEPGTAARVLRDFAKNHDKLVVKALALGGKLLDASQLEAVAKLPTRDEALATLLRTMKAPVTQFVRTMVEPYASLTRVLAAIRDKKQQ